MSEVVGLGVLGVAQSDPLGLVGEVLSSPLVKLGMFGSVGFCMAMWLGSVYWTYNDAEMRGVSGVWWAVGAFVFPYAGALFYKVVRPPEYEQDQRERRLTQAVLERELKGQIEVCPSCRGMIEKEHAFCPACGWQAKRPCRHCREPMRPSWAVCPHCGASQQDLPRQDIGRGGGGRRQPHRDANGL